MKILVAYNGERQRAALEQIVARAPQASLVASVSDLSATYTVAEHKVPDIVLMDCAFANLPEFEVLALLFKALRIRCVLVASAQEVSDRETALALRFGLDCVSLRGVAPVLQPRAAFAVPGRPAGTAALPASEPVAFDSGFILLGASTGGVDALIQVLSSFPADCPPTLIVQHTGSQFTSGLARLIDGHVRPAVCEADTLAVPKPGHVFLAPGGMDHMVMNRSAQAHLRFEPATASPGHCPSIDKLFLSAVPHARKTVAALLTGMGRDGAAGLLALRKAGARTFAQDERTSVVYGMPRAAMELSAAERQLPLAKIGPALLQARRRQHA